MATATGDGATGYNDDNDGNWQQATKSTITATADGGTGDGATGYDDNNDDGGGTTGDEVDNYG
jgi:hypothetical protein